MDALQDYDKMQHLIVSLKSNSNYYYMNRFPVKNSLKHVQNARKLKTRVDCLKKQMDILSTSAKKQQLQILSDIQKNPIPQQRSHKKIITTKKYTHKIISSQCIPSLVIQKQPLRFHTEATKPHSKKSALQNLMGSSSLERSFGRLSQSMYVWNPELKQNHLFSEGGLKMKQNDFKNASRTQSIRFFRPKSQKFLMTHEDRHGGQPKKSTRSEQKLKGWEVKCFQSIQKQELQCHIPI